MKKSNIHDFSVPTRQSFAAVFIIAYKLYRIIFRQLFPIIILVLIQGKLVKSPVFIYSLIGLATLATIYSILSFFRFYFFVKGKKLIVEKGVFKKSVIEIPFDRIQSINFDQNLIHRIFNVVKVNMDTAGSADKEMQLYALDKSLARTLSALILQSPRKSVLQKIDNSPIKNEILPDKRIFKLGLLQLLKVGATENHIRSGGIIVFFFFYIFESLEDFGIDIIEKGEQYVPMAQQLTQSLLIVAAFLLIFSIIAFIISIVRTILTYYDLQMFRKASGFVIVSGLINKRERAAKDIKIQLIKVSQNLLQRLTGIYEFVLRQASSVAVSDAKSIKVVGLSQNNINQSLSYILKSHYNGLGKLEMSKVDFYFLFKRLYYSFLAGLILCTISILAKRLDLLIYAVVLLLIFITASFLAYKKRRYGYSSELFKLEGGTFGLNSKIIESYKIQDVIMRSSYFQRRRSLVSLKLHTASGSINIPDIKQEKAKQMVNELLLVVEKSRKSWM